MKNLVMFLMILAAFTVLSGCDWWRCTQDDRTFNNTTFTEARSRCRDHCGDDSGCDTAITTQVGATSFTCECE